MQRGASLGIEADGTIKGCPSLATDTYAGGNVRDMPLSEIWKTTSELAYIRGRSTKDLWGFCGTCYYASACLGGCTWTAHSLFGRPGNNPYCHYRALKLKELGHIERVRLVEPASGVPFDNGRFELIVEDLEGRVVSVWNPSDETFSCDRSGINSPHDKHELLLCSNCDQFALPDAAHCPHCGKATLQTLSQHATREAEFSPALRRIREALGLEQPAIEG